MAPKNYARTFGQDLMRGEHVVGGKPMRKTEAGLTWVGGNRDYEDLDEASRKILAASSSGTSIFDPVLCELSYRWFYPPGGKILDPFAGGSVRGVVASELGFLYTGVELRAEQVAANRAQADIATGPVPQWYVGDSRGIKEIAPGEYDMVFSCPPYADLEVYSDDPADLSTLDYGAFLAAYRDIIAATCAMLKDDRFAVFVVGEVRDKRGNYYGFVPDTVSAFRDAGLNYYNEAVLVTAAGSLPIRTGKQFRASRKIGKTHQNALVFVKGDGKKAAAACNAANDNKARVNGQ